jgi:hypothetical protein
MVKISKASSDAVRFFWDERQKAALKVMDYISTDENTLKAIFGNQYLIIWEALGRSVRPDIEVNEEMSVVRKRPSDGKDEERTAVKRRV